MNFELKPTNKCVVEVTPETSYMERTPQGEYNEACCLKSDINRHIDNGGTYINQTYEYSFTSDDYDDTRFETLYEAISTVILDDMFSYKVTGKRNDKEEYPTSQHRYSFKEVLEEVYRYPYECKVDGELTAKERSAIDKVIGFRTNN